MLNIKQVVQSLSAVMKAFTYLPVREFQRYSTDEIVVGQWTDGKPLYRKVINMTFPSDIRSGTVKSSTVAFADLGLASATVVWYEAYIPSLGITLPWISKTYYAKLQTAGANFLAEADLTIEYTKTTD